MRGNLTIVRGLPGSGKTTWAREYAATFGAIRLNRDDLRSMMFGRKVRLDYEQEKAVTAAQHDAARALLTAGWDVVVDDTNLRPKYVRPWAAIAADTGARVTLHEMPLDVDVAVAQDKQRPDPVGSEVITGLARKYTRHGCYLPVDLTPPQLKARPRPYTPPEGAPEAILVDIDGTLAVTLTGRSPYDWSRVGEDAPVDAVVRAVRDAHAAGAVVVYMSGRDEVCRDATVEWLNRCVGIDPGGRLHMRPAGDTRNDAVVKAELFDEHVRDRYRVRYVLDDRQRVVDMWRAMGLAVFQVAPGDF